MCACAGLKDLKGASHCPRGKHDLHPRDGDLQLCLHRARKAPSPGRFKASADAVLLDAFHGAAVLSTKILPDLPYDGTVPACRPTPRWKYR